MINGVPQKYGQEYKATNTTCNEKKRVFTTDIAKAYPAEAKVKNWNRSYALDDRKLTITDSYTERSCSSQSGKFYDLGECDFPFTG